MPINRFDRPAQAEFINTYVPIPFKEMMMAGQAKQQRYDQTASAMDQSIANAEQLMAIPDSMDEQYIEQVRSSMYDIRNKYADKDLSDSMVRRQMNAEINRLDKNRINRIQQSYAGYKEYNKMAFQADTPEELRQDFTGYDTESTSGVFAGQPERRLDIRKKMETYFDNVHETDLGFRDEKNLPGYKSRWKGVKEEDLVAIARKNAEDFANSPEGIQLKKILNKRGLSDEAVQEQFENAARENAWELPGTPFQIGTGDSDFPNIPQGDLTGTRGLEGDPDKSLRQLRNYFEDLKNDPDLAKQILGKEYEDRLIQIENEIRSSYSDELITNYNNIVDSLVSSGLANKDRVEKLINRVKDSPQDYSTRATTDLLTSGKFTREPTKEEKRIITDFAKNLNFTERTIKDEIKKTGERELNEGIQPQYALEPPLVYSKGLDFYIDQRTQVEVPSKFAKLVKNNLLNPGDVAIKIFNAEGKEGKIDKDQLPQYNTVNMNTNVSLLRKNKYRPTVRVNLEHKDDPTKTAIAEMTISNPTQHQSLVDEQAAAGNIKTAVMLGNPHISEQVDLLSSNVPTSIKLTEDEEVMILPGKQVGTFIIDYGSGQLSEIDGELIGRERLKNLLIEYLADPRRGQ